MPNWCSNKLTVSGSATHLKRLLKACANPPEGYIKEYLEAESHVEFSFAGIVPPPKSLGNNFTNWTRENWGTKWDINQNAIPLIDFDEIDDETLDPDDPEYPSILASGKVGEATNEISFFHIEFDTAWSPPEYWLVKASAQYPDLQFELKYCEPGNNIAGKFFAKDGEYTQEDWEVTPGVLELFGFTTLEEE